MQKIQTQANLTVLPPTIKESCKTSATEMERRSKDQKKLSTETLKKNQLRLFKEDNSI